jgi:hypothetical protein
LAKPSAICNYKVWSDLKIIIQLKNYELKLSAPISHQSAYGETQDKVTFVWIYDFQT